MAQARKTTRPREAAGGVEPSAAGGEMDELLGLLAEASKRVDDAEARAAKAEELAGDYLSTAQRMKADLENSRKRWERDREAAAAAAGERVLGSLLSVLDDLERALEGVGDSTPAPVREGLAAVARNFREALAREGLTEIEAEDALFDPHVHEALTAVAVPGIREGAVVQVVRRGFRLGDRVLRPAQVIVAAAPEKGE
jgi:molecular chaperone GrpE